jgi:hypothetical protein
MTDIEARLRETLAEALEPMAAEHGRAAATIRRARRGRALRGAAVGLATVLVVAVAAFAWERPDDPDPPPPAAPAYTTATTFGLAFESGEGTLTIDASKAQTCMDLTGDIPGFGGSLHYDADGPEDPVVASFGSGFTKRNPPRCATMLPSDARRVLAETARHYVALSPSGISPASALHPLDVPPALLPDVATIVCSQSGAVALTPEVQPQDDGVHLRFHYEGSRWNAFNLVNDEGDNEGGDLHERENVSAFPPGPLYAGCYENLFEVPMSPRDPSYTKLTIVDPHGLWTEDDLDCPVPEKRRPIDIGEPLASRRDFDDLIREHLPGLEAGDVLDRPRYPRTDFVYETRTVVRDGRRIAGVRLVPRDPNWAIAAEVCPGARIGAPTP